MADGINIGINLPESSGKAISDAVGLAEPVVADASGFLSRVVGKPLSIASGLLSDQLYAWRWRNRIKIVELARHQLESRRIPPKVLPPGFLMPLLDAAGDCDQEDMQDLWANLLVGSVVDAGKSHVLHVETLRRMQSQDAKLLEALVRIPRKHPREVFDVSSFSEQDRRSLDRLVTLGIFEFETKYELSDNPARHGENELFYPAYVVEIGDSEAFGALTGYGVEFHEAVRTRA